MAEAYPSQLDAVLWGELFASETVLAPLGRGDLDDATFRLLADAIPTLCWVANGDGYIVWYNRRWHSYCGTTPEQMEGWGWTTVHDPELLPSVMERWTQAIASGASFEMTFPLKGVDGLFRPFLTRVQPVRDADGAVARWFGVNTEISGQVQAEDELRRERDRSRGVLDGMREGFALLDHDFRLIDINAEALRLETLSKAEVLGRSYWEIYPGSEASEIGRLYRKAMGERVPVSLEHRYVWPDGRASWIDMRAYPVSQGLAIFYRDVSRRKADEDALRASEGQRAISEETLRLATDAAEIGTWDVDLNTDVLIWSDRTKAAFGISPDASAPDGMSDFYAGLHPDDRKATSDAFGLATDPAVRAFYDVEYRAVGKEDRIIRRVAAKGKAVFDDAGRCVRFLGTAIDVTARRADSVRLLSLDTELERQVIDRASERGRTWQVTPDLMGVLNSDGYFESSNPAWRSVLGWSEAEISANVFFTFIHPDDLVATQSIWSAAIERGEPAIRFENRNRGKDGRYRWLSWVAVPEGGKIYCSARDVTIEKEAAEALVLAQEALRQSQKMEAVGQLTGGIAHDFNNMLAVVIGSLDLLSRRNGAADARTKRYIDAASDAARRAATLTQRLLAFSRQQPLKPEPLDVNKLVAGMSELIRGSLSSDVQLETVLSSGLWRTYADPNQLENVLLNLSVNARDAMPEGGRLTLETQNAHLDARYVAAHLGVSAGQYVLVAVSDTGSGMPEDVIAKAFDPFFTTKAVGKGTGLGLSQVYGFVKQSGGHVKIYSEPGQGTTVKVYLPRRMGGESEIVEDNAGMEHPKGDKEEIILVVEDEPAVRQLSVDVLSELGYRVLEADGAAAALRLLDAHPAITMLFTDIVMPEVNGAKLAEEARRRRPHLRVLFTTGYTRNAVTHNGVLDPGVDLLGKPFTIEELAAKVRQVLDADLQAQRSLSEDVDPTGAAVR